MNQHPRPDNQDPCETDPRGSLQRWVDALDVQPGESPDRIDILQHLLGPNLCRQLGIYRLPADFLLSVVVPVYNEVRTLPEVIRRVRSTGIPTQIIVVDDGSTDGSRQLVESWRDEPDVVVQIQPRNEGKGAALRAGFGRAQGNVVVIQDADLEYDPADYWSLIAPLVHDQADVVFGSRMKASRQRVLYFWHYVGNRFLTLLSNIRTNLNLTDMETGSKAFRRETLEQVLPHLREKRFGIEPELTVRMARVPGVRVFEMPISYHGRTYAEGKKISWRDGLRAIWCLLRY
ncbi:MAG: glycosyltransferase family 2 protein [Planctomycetia bacterium]|nr:MAG: glycosyltransferase family 2 protein [Planctomycetia bacterium]